jgi:hypothetical protein
MRELLDAKGAAAYLHLASQILAKMRLSGMGPPYYRATCGWAADHSPFC